jgi:hypothetical protein
MAAAKNQVLAGQMDLEASGGGGEMLAAFCSGSALGAGGGGGRTRMYLGRVRRYIGIKSRIRSNL